MGRLAYMQQAGWLLRAELGMQPCLHPINTAGPASEVLMMTFGCRPTYRCTEACCSAQRPACKHSVGTPWCDPGHTWLTLNSELHRGRLQKQTGLPVDLAAVQADTAAAAYLKESTPEAVLVGSKLVSIEVGPDHVQHCPALLVADAVKEVFNDPCRVNACGQHSIGACQCKQYCVSACM